MTEDKMCYMLRYCGNKIQDLGELRWIKQIPSFQTCKYVLYQSLGKMVPKCPITLHEIILLNPCSWQILVVWWQRLCRKLNKCICHCQNFQRLCVSSTVMEHSTPLFVQLYTLHADGTVFPLSSLFGDSSERPPISTYPGILDDQPVARNLLKKKFPNTTI